MQQQPAVQRQTFGGLQNPVILLCDEATSALDSRTEKQILQALQTLAHGRTSLFVAHRLSTAAQCDQIVVLEGVSCHTVFSDKLHFAIIS